MPRPTADYPCACGCDTLVTRTVHNVKNPAKLFAPGHRPSKRKMVTLTCLHCGASFTKWSKRVNDPERSYCCMEHLYAHRDKHPKEAICMTCGTTYKPQPDKEREAEGFYCSTKCWHGRRYALSTLPPWDAPPPLAGYLAGFLDGDGSISINRAHSGRIEVRLGNTHHDTLLWVHTSVPLTSYIRERPSKNPRHKPMYEVSWHGPQAHGVLTQIMPHLIIKRSMASHAIAFHTSLLSTKERHAVTMPQALPCYPTPCPTGPPVSEKVFWAYMAGFIDAEGCIRVNGRLATLEVTITNTHLCVLQHLQKYCKIHCSYSTHVPKNQKWFPLTTLRFYKSSAATLLCKILPFLHVKTLQAQLGVRFQSLQPLSEESAFIIKEIHRLNS